MGKELASRCEIQRIAFVPARNADAHSINPAELGLILLNDPVEVPMGRHTEAGRTVSEATARQHELFKQEDVPMAWSKFRRVGAGLSNLGNTCFMNSVLQCLLHTPPLAELLLSGRHLSAMPPSNGFDPIALTRQLLHDVLRQRDYVSPQLHARSLKRISRSFRIGRQEDAHEYLIALLDSMHERSIAGLNPKPPPAIEFTSFIYRIFGGRIRSQVKCSQCGYESNTYDPFLDLSLEINHAHSVERALQRFTAGEVLDGPNKYKCPKQNRAVRAVKRMTVDSAPNVLVVQLKRFEFSLSGRKISKPVSFGESLDLSPYMSTNPELPALYDLYGVLVHQGHSMHSGHYYCFVKGAGGNEWHKFDDTRVHTTSIRNVMGQLPYILFYVKRQPPQRNQKPMASVPTSGQAAPAAPEPAPLKVEIRETNQEAPLENGKKIALKRPREADTTVPEEANGSRKRQQKQKANLQMVRQPLADGKGASDDDNDDCADRTFRRPLLRSQTRSGGIPTLSPIALASLGRRGKRRAEQQLLLSWSMMTKSSSAAKRRRAGLDGEVDENDGPQWPPYAPQPGRRDKDAEDAVEHSNNSLGSAVPAPDWPPIKQKKVSLKGGNTATTKVGAGTRVSGVEEVREFLRKASASAQDMKLEAWEGTAQEDQRKRDRLVALGTKSRRDLDEYDVDYDRGKLKKVKSKDKVEPPIDSGVFDKHARAAVQLKGRNRKAVLEGRRTNKYRRE